MHLITHNYGVVKRILEGSTHAGRWFRLDTRLSPACLAAARSEGPRNCKEDTLLAGKELPDVDLCPWVALV